MMKFEFMDSIDLTKFLPREVICYILTLEKIISGEMWASLLEKKAIPLVKPLKTKTLSKSYNLLLKSKSAATEETCDLMKFGEFLSFNITADSILFFESIPEIINHPKRDDIINVRFFSQESMTIQISFINNSEENSDSEDSSSDEECFFLETKLTHEIAFDSILKFLYHSSDRDGNFGGNIYSF